MDPALIVMLHAVQAAKANCMPAASLPLLSLSLSLLRELGCMYPHEGGLE
jgi:hypothetical protein